MSDILVIIGIIATLMVGFLPLYFKHLEGLKETENKFVGEVVEKIKSGKIFDVGNMDKFISEFSIKHNKDVTKIKENLHEIILRIYLEIEYIDLDDLTIQSKLLFYGMEKEKSSKKRLNKKAIKYLNIMYGLVVIGLLALSYLINVIFELKLMIFITYSLIILNILCYRKILNRLV